MAPAGRGQSASNEFWQGQSIYQIVTDRFFDGDSSNNNADGNFNPSGPPSVHGGDFKGIEQKLDYIQALGATAIWISPVVLNANGEFHGYAGREKSILLAQHPSMGDMRVRKSLRHRVHRAECFLRL